MKDRLIYLDYLGGQCVNCGLSVDEIINRHGPAHRVFKFHHVDPNQKDKDYSNLVQWRICKETLDEIDKCILLCGNCHDILHSQSISGKMRIVMELENRLVEQTIMGNYILDQTENQINFLSNEPLYLHPYKIRSG